MCWKIIFFAKTAGENEDNGFGVETERNGDNRFIAKERGIVGETGLSQSQVRIKRIKSQRTINGT